MYLLSQKPPQGASEVGHRELLCGPRGGICEEQDRPDAGQSGTPSVEQRLKESKHIQEQACVCDDSPVPGWRSVQKGPFLLSTFGSSSLLD